MNVWIRRIQLPDGEHVVGVVWGVVGVVVGGVVWGVGGVVGIVVVVGATGGGVGEEYTHVYVFRWRRGIGTVVVGGL